MKALKINVATQQVEEIEIKDWREISPAIGNECTNFECPVSFENEDCFYCDEEGLFHTIEGGFIMDKWGSPIVGNALLIGTDNEGDSVDVKTTKEELMNQLTWVSKDEANDYADLFR